MFSLPRNSSGWEDSVLIDELGFSYHCQSKCPNLRRCAILKANRDPCLVQTGCCGVCGSAVAFFQCNMPKLASFLCLDGSRTQPRRVGMTYVFTGSRLELGALSCSLITQTCSNVTCHSSCSRYLQLIILANRALLDFAPPPDLRFSTISIDS